MKKNTPKKIAYIVPGLDISGGIAIVLQHVKYLNEKGYDARVLNYGNPLEKISWFPYEVPFINITNGIVSEFFDVVVATQYNTVKFAKKLNSSRKIYFVQSDERRFDPGNIEVVSECEMSYKENFEYMTEAVWIQRWLKEEFGHDAYYVPNGLDDKIIYRTAPIQARGKRVRVLLEGPINVIWKGMDDAYSAIKDLDCEIWIISSNGEIKDGWRFDRFFHQVPFNKMKEIYSSCDIFLKMSRVEGFFGPPLEAMACGCAVVVGKVTGYDEYIKNGYNSIVVEQSDVDGAKKAVQQLIENKKFRDQLIKNGEKTAGNWTWDKSIDSLEKVMEKEDFVKYYTETYPEKYEYIQTIKKILFNLVHTDKNEIKSKEQTILKLNENIEQKNQEIKTKIQKIEWMKSSRFWKLKIFYEKFKFPVFKFGGLIKKALFVLKRDGLFVLIKKVYEFFLYKKEYINYKIKLFLQNYNLYKKNNKFNIENTINNITPKRGTSLIKPIAMYLPQFHESIENNEWWGKGFTEWNHIREFKPLYEGHTACKPHPDIGYYDLTDVEIRKKQAELAKEYGVYGFCYYHYWSNGKLLLNKPTELMLLDGEPNLPFMFSWANHDWTRKWENKGTDILWKQEYEGINDLENHFKYLLNFFKHPNYIKINNKPCFVIYVPILVPDLEIMIKYWNKRAIEEGFDGIYFIGTELSFNKQKIFYKSEIFDSYYIQEPSHAMYSKNMLINKGRYNSFDSEAFYSEIEEFTSPIKNRTTYIGTCVGFDNTSRIKNIDNIALIMENGSPELFESHLKNIFLKLKKGKSEEQFFFITAWNEWGEGSVLEPSDKYGYAYLNAIKNALSYINKMKILIVAEITSISGSPMYNYTLAIELKAQGYDVDFYSISSNHEIKRRLLQNGISIITNIDINIKYKLTLISQPTHVNLLKIIKSENIFNIIHSEYVEETPIDLPIIDKYIAIRPSIKDHLIKEHHIDESKIEVIYNGVDLDRFNPSKRKKHEGDYIKVVLPCTIHDLRIPFIKYYIDKANKNYRVYIYGHGLPLSNFNLPNNKWVFVEDVKFDIENYIYDADFVAGILLGRVNLEAKAMGIPSYIHDPSNPNNFYKFELDEAEFKKKHDIKNVATSIIKLYESIK